MERMLCEVEEHGRKEELAKFEAQVATNVHSGLLILKNASEILNTRLTALESKANALAVTASKAPDVRTSTPLPCLLFVLLLVTSSLMLSGGFWCS